MIKDRDISIDVLRILACVFVVLLHTAALYMPTFQSEDFDLHTWKIASIYDSFTRWTVPVFVMISGAFIFQKEIPIGRLFKRYIGRLLLILLTWNILYNLSFLISHFSLRIAISCVFTPYYHLWFLYMLIAVYAVSPILKKVVDSRLTGYFLMLWLVCDVLFGQLSDMGVESLERVSRITEWFTKYASFGFAGYFVLGYYFYKQRPFTAKQRKVVSVVGIAAVICVMSGMLLLSDRMGEKVFFLYDNMNILTVLTSLGIFALFTPPIMRLKMRKLRVVIR